MTEEIHLCMRNLFINTDDSIKILDIYYEISQTDFIEDLIEFESSYDKIKSYVSIFIELDIIEAKFPHKRLH
jgi:hypothetical protein